MVFGEMFSSFGFSPALVLAIILISIWDGVWRAIALWKSGRNKQLGWFVCLFIFNTMGILPIIYILLFQKKRERQEKRTRRRARRR
jgi:methionyl-tRNA synthetase